MKAKLKKSVVDLSVPEDFTDQQLQGNIFVIPVQVTRKGGAGQLFRYSSEFAFSSQAPTSGGRFDGTVHQIMWTTPTVPYMIEFVTVELRTNLTFTGGTIDDSDSLRVRAVIDSGTTLFDLLDASAGPPGVPGITSSAYSLSTNPPMWSTHNSGHRGAFANDNLSATGYVSGGGKFSTNNALYQGKNLEVLFNSPDFTITTMTGTVRVHVGVVLINM